MDPRKKSLRVGLTAIACAVLIRLLPCLEPDSLARFLSKPGILTLINYLQTGRYLSYSPEESPQAPRIELSFPQPELVYCPESPPPEPPPRPWFESAENLHLWYLCPYRPDLDALLRRPLTWDLASGAPTVLIYHTHTTESYEKNGADYEESAPYRTTDEHYNMLSVGDRITERLEQAGIVTLHDRTFHDWPDYNGSYGRSRKTAVQYIKEYPSLELILDLHRDACDEGTGQLRTHAIVDGRDSAQLMVVAGTNASGLSHSHWQDNLALGLKLQAQLEASHPGMTRPLSLRSQRFNQDLSPGALLIEVGGAGNSLEEALLAGDVLAEAIVSLARGTESDPPRPGLLPLPPE